MFTNEKKVQPGKAILGNEPDNIQNGQDLTIGEIFRKKLYTNYVLVAVDVIVKNPGGEELVSYCPNINTSPIGAYETLLVDAMDAARLTPYANGKNTIHLYARLSNGELLEVFNTILKVD